MRSLFCVILLAVSCVSLQEASADCANGSCDVTSLQVRGGVFWRVPRPRLVVPAPVVCRPQVICTPMQYKGTSVEKCEYPTPVRNLILGRYRIFHSYAPAVTK